MLAPSSSGQPGACVLGFHQRLAPAAAPQVLSIYYQALSSALRAEHARQGGRSTSASPAAAAGPGSSSSRGSGGGSGGQVGGGLRALFSSRTFHASLMACAAECVVASYQMVSGTAG